MSRSRRPTTVILDVDGTLVNSNDAQAMAWLEALRDAGFRHASFERIRPLIGMEPGALLAHAVGVAADSIEGRNILDNRAHTFARRYLPGVKPVSGVRPLLERMKRQGLSLIVASASGLDETLGLIWAAGVPDLLDDAITYNDVTGAAASSLLELALAQAGVPGEAVLLLADTPYDIDAGSHAGVDVVVFRSGGWADAALEGAVAIYRDPRDLLRHYSLSPFFPAAVASYAAPRLSAIGVPVR
jgi:phosphoglycolate phosphatase-like HAD superfamily hydrolase